MIGPQEHISAGAEESKLLGVQRIRRRPRGRNTTKSPCAKARRDDSKSSAHQSKDEADPAGPMKTGEKGELTSKAGTRTHSRARTARTEQHRAKGRGRTKGTSTGDEKSRSAKTTEQKLKVDTETDPAQSAASASTPMETPRELVTPLPLLVGDAVIAEVKTVMHETKTKEETASWTTIRYPAGEVVVNEWGVMLRDMLPEFMTKYLPEPLSGLTWAEIKLPTDLYNRAVMRFSGKQKRNTHAEYEQVTQEFYSGIQRHPLCTNIDMRAAVTALLHVTFVTSLAMQRTFEVYMRSQVAHVEKGRESAAIGTRLTWTTSWSLRVLATTAFVASGAWFAMKWELSRAAKRVRNVTGVAFTALLVGGLLFKSLAAKLMDTVSRKRKVDQVELKPLIKQVGNYVFPDVRLTSELKHPTATWSLAHHRATQDAGRFDTSNPAAYFTGPPPERMAVVWKSMITKFDAPLPTRLVVGEQKEFVVDKLPCADGDYTPSRPYYAVGPSVTPMVPCLFDTNAPLNIRSCIVKHFSIDHRTRDVNLHVFDDRVAVRSYGEVMEILKGGSMSRPPSSLEEYWNHLTARQRVDYATHVLINREGKHSGSTEKRLHRRELFLKREFIVKRDSLEGGTVAKVRGIVSYKNKGWYFMDGPLCYNLLKSFAYPFVSLSVSSVVSGVNRFPVVCCASGSSPLQVGDWLYTLLKMADHGYVAFAENDYSSYDSTQGARSLKRTMLEFKANFTLTPDEKRAWKGMIDKDIGVAFKSTDGKRKPKFKFSAHGNMDSGCNGTTLFNSFSNAAVTRRAHMVALDEIRGLGMCELYQMVLGDDNVLALVATESLLGKEGMLKRYWGVVEREIKSAGYLPKLLTPPAHTIQFCSQVFAPVVITETKVGPQGQTTPYSRESRLLVPNVTRFLHKFGWCHTALTRWTESECAAYLRDVCKGEPRMAFVPILRILHAHYSNLGVDVKRGAERAENNSWKHQEVDVVNIMPSATDYWFHAIYGVTEAEVGSCEALLTEALLANPIGQFYFDHPVIARMCEQEPLNRQ